MLFGVQPSRPIDVRGDGGIADHRGVVSFLYSGAARDEGRPDGRAALRVRISDLRV